jgi:hypothetical protein
MPFTEQDRSRIYYHLGYPDITSASSVQLGFPALSQPQFLVSYAMDRLNPASVPRAIRILNILDGVEGQMVSALKRLQAQQLGELKLRNTNEESTEQDLLEREYSRWAQRLADILGVPINPYATRYGALEGGGAINTPVVNS